MTRPPVRDLAAVLLGGGVGTGLRLGIDTLLPHAEGTLAISTLVVNTLGAFALGLLVARVWPVAPTWLRAGLGAGLLGSFTTYSALAVNVVALGASGDPVLAAAMIAASIVLGLGAAWLGLRTGRPAVPGADE